MRICLDPTTTEQSSEEGTVESVFKKWKEIVLLVTVLHDLQKEDFMTQVTNLVFTLVKNVVPTLFNWESGLYLRRGVYRRTSIW